MTTSNATAPTLLMLDIETNGLDKMTHRILEVGAIALTDELEEIEACDVQIYEPNARDGADPFVQAMHSANGLWAACADNRVGHTLPRPAADVWLAGWLEHLGYLPGTVILCGHTIDFDHGFVMQHLPKTAKFLHYRKDDLGAVGRFLRRCGLEVDYHRKEEYTHRGLADCRLELEDARKVRAHIHGLMEAEARLAGLDK